MSETRQFSPEQVTVLHDNTVQAMSGLAIRYCHALESNAAAWDYPAPSTPVDSEPLFQSGIAAMRRAAMAEVPLAFSVEPRFSGVSVEAIRINPQTGEVLPYSSVQIGIVGGPAGEGLCNPDFEPEDLHLAIERLRAQMEAQLTFGSASLPESYV